jgi:hypothetical protein
VRLRLRHRDRALASLWKHGPVRSRRDRPLDLRQHLGEVPGRGDRGNQRPHPVLFQSHRRSGRIARRVSFRSQHDATLSHHSVPVRRSQSFKTSISVLKT